ncbi:PIR protein [Plasmodium yoelii]|uniref:PIR protein n=2 Tax=Plasmodium yoelii TaxID=5861 RepID=A0AAF0AYD5_PLAYO|nr:PIR protein [Plasmodium yoelii]WBY54912.1 PIR protein [Plasmodium yoelii yoelii]CDU16189.1 YIR protein [Plasmodium yoelii]VTZ72336.1 PIR protein [Plasmodium yoelii]|eukprot:XP_022811412.1 PIR protein [Plasmodium yoelii]
MADVLCRDFETIWKFFSDELNNSKEYYFNSGMLKNYCPSNNCDTNIKKINAGCLWLFNAFFGRSGTSNYGDRYKDVVLCIMIWLSYKLSLNPSDNITTLKDFYSNNIENNEEYDKHKPNDENYTNYKKMIDEMKDYMDINISHMSKFYELLKLLCNMNTANTKKDNDSVFLQYANQFVNKYEELFNDDNNNDNNSYNKVLGVFSKYYNNFGSNTLFSNTPKNLPPLPTEKTGKKGEAVDSKATEITVSSSGTDKSNHVKENPSSNITLPGSSLVNKLIPVLSILFAIAIFWGIAYKYSLFGFRKRAQKQYLRKKLKK